MKNRQVFLGPRCRRETVSFFFCLIKILDCFVLSPLKHYFSEASLWRRANTRNFSFTAANLKFNIRIGKWIAHWLFVKIMTGAEWSKHLLQKEEIFLTEITAFHCLRSCGSLRHNLPYVQISNTRWNRHKIDGGNIIQFEFTYSTPKI